jgi:hypothetical protein
MRKIDLRGAVLKVVKTHEHSKKALEWILRNRCGKIETTPREQHEEPLRDYLEQGYKEVIRMDYCIRLDKGNDFIMYDLNKKCVILEYHHNGNG